MYYANFVFFLFKGSGKCGFPPCCPVQVLSFALCCASFVVLSEQIKMTMMMMMMMIWSGLIPGTVCLPYPSSHSQVGMLDSAYPVSPPMDRSSLRFTLSTVCRMSVGAR